MRPELELTSIALPFPGDSWHVVVGARSMYPRGTLPGSLYHTTTYDAAKFGSLSMRLGLGWSKSASMHTGQCPVMKYHRPLMNAIMYDKIKIADAVNAKVISLEDAPKGYDVFDKGAAAKYVIDPHGMTGMVASL